MSATQAGSTSSGNLCHLLVRRARRVAMSKSVTVRGMWLEPLICREGAIPCPCRFVELAWLPGFSSRLTHVRFLHSSDRSRNRMTRRDTTTLSAKFQISIPKAVREAKRWRAGQVFAFIPKGEGMLLVPVPGVSNLPGSRAVQARSTIAIGLTASDAACGYLRLDRMADRFTGWARVGGRSTTVGPVAGPDDRSVGIGQVAHSGGGRG